MERAPLPAATTFVLVIGVSCLSIAGSLNYLGNSVWSLVATSAQSSATDGPDFVGGIEPLATGSVSAIVPLAATGAGAQAPAPIQEVVPPQPTEMVASATSGTGMPLADSTNRMRATIAVNVRDRPSNDSNVIGTLRQGTAVAVLASHQGWMHVSDGNRDGWVYGRYLQPAR